MLKIVDITGSFQAELPCELAKCIGSWRDMVENKYSSIMNNQLSRFPDYHANLYACLDDEPEALKRFMTLVYHQEPFMITACQSHPSKGTQGGRAIWCQHKPAQEGRYLTVHRSLIMGQARM